MIDKSFLKETIRDYFPDLENTKFNFNNNPISLFTEQSLLPFLIYQNTIDVHRRVIGLYLPENCDIINLIPFYVMMGQYRKALNSLSQKNDYKTESFSPSQKQVIFNGDICSLSSVDFMNRILTIRSGRGREVNVSFFEAYKVDWMKSASDVENKVRSFDAIDKASKFNIFTFPVSPTTDEYEGVLIFTNSSKFESLLQNVRVSGTDFREHLNIQKAVFPSDDDICFKQLSKSQTSKKPISLVIARHDSFRTYDALLSAGKGKVDHIKTVIIDDFDELIQRWKKSDMLGEEIDTLNEIYFQKVQNGQLKDLYLISRNSRLDVHAILKEHAISYNPWLLKPLEELSINTDTVNFIPEITVTNIDNVRFENMNEKLDFLISKWKDLAQSGFCNGEILKPINFLYELRTKLNSFFDPDSLNGVIENFEDTLNLLQKNWFSAGQDYGIIEETRKFLPKIPDTSSCFINFKLQSILEELSNKDLSGSINIVSGNNDSADIKWLTESIVTAYPKIKVTHCYKKDFCIQRKSDNFLPSIIFYLTSDKKIIGLVTGNILAEKQTFILNKRTYGFTENYMKKYQRLQSEVGSTSVKYELLNLKAIPDSPHADQAGLINVLYNKHEINLGANEPEIAVQETELSELVEEIVKKYYNSSKEPSEKYILFFDDGTLSEEPESRRFFVYEDDKESDDLEKILKSVSVLKKGDQIVVTRRGLELKELLKQALKKSDQFARALEMDEMWRLLVRNHINRSGMDLDYFCKKLLQNNFKISPAAVRNWIDGETRRPDNFIGLLQALSSLNIINKDEIVQFNKYNSELKSIQIKFVRLAIQKLIARLNGINFEEDKVFNDSLLSDFINHIEIKRISNIYKM